MTQAAIRTASLLALFFVLAPLALAQPEYDFDGGVGADPPPADPTDWMTPENWNEGGFDTIDPPIPDFDIRVEITTSEVGVNAPVIGPGDTAEAFGVRIGREEGEGLLIMNGGTLDVVDRCNLSPFNCDSRIRVGNAQTETPGLVNDGTFQMDAGVVNTDTLWIGSGSHGEMHMSGGTVNTRGDLSLDWTDDFASELNMTGGTINVATSLFSSFQSLRMYRNSVLNLDGGEILIQGKAEFGIESVSTSAGGSQTPSVNVSIDGGLLAADEDLLVNGVVSMSGGILRAGSFDLASSTGTIEINANGLLQLNNANVSVSAAESLISSGVINTSGASDLIVQVVDVGGTDFTQVSVASTGSPADLNMDGFVDGLDLGILLGNFEQNASPGGGELNGTDPVDGLDLGILLGAWSPPASLSAVANVPEPISLTLAMFASTALAMSRRR